MNTIEKLIVGVPLVALFIVAGFVIYLNVADEGASEAGKIDEQAISSVAASARKIEPVSYQTLDQLILSTEEKWEEISVEDKYAKGLGDETYQVLSSFIPEAHQLNVYADEYDVKTELRNLQTTAEKLTSPLEELPKEERKTLISWFGTQLEQATVKVKNRQ